MKTKNKHLNWKGAIWKLTKWILKLSFKIFLIVLWGSLHLVEVILTHFNKWLKEKIN